MCGRRRRSRCLLTLKRLAGGAGGRQRSASNGNDLQVGDSGKQGSPLQLVAEEGLTDL